MCETSQYLHQCEVGGTYLILCDYYSLDFFCIKLELHYTERFTDLDKLIFIIVISGLSHFPLLHSSSASKTKLASTVIKSNSKTIISLR